MLDPLLELQIVLGILFWLSVHQLGQHGWYLHQRRQQSGKIPIVRCLLAPFLFIRTAQLQHQ